METEPHLIVVLYIQRWPPYRFSV